MEGGQAELVTAMARGGAAGSDGTMRRPEREEMARPGTRVWVRGKVAVERGEAGGGLGILTYPPGGSGVEAGATDTAAWWVRHGYSEEDDVGFTENPLPPSSFSEISVLT